MAKPVPGTLQSLLTFLTWVTDFFDLGHDTWAGICNLSPKKSVKLIREHNQDNRPKSDTRIDYLGRQWYEGEWIAGLAQVFCGYDGAMGNGQHTGTLPQTLGVAIPTLFLVDMRRTGQEIMQHADRINKRTSAQDFKIMGYAFPNQLAHVSQWLYRMLNNTVTHGKFQLSTFERIKYILTPHPDLQEVIGFCEATKPSKYVGRKSIITSCCYLAHQACEKDAQEFFGLLGAQRVKQKKIQPVNKFVTWATDIIEETNSVSSIREWQLVEALGQAWNAYRCGDKVKKFEFPSSARGFSVPDFI